MKRQDRDDGPAWLDYVIIVLLAALLALVALHFISPGSTFNDLSNGL